MRVYVRRTVYDAARFGDADVLIWAASQIVEARRRPMSVAPVGDDVARSGRLVAELNSPGPAACKISALALEVAGLVP